MHACDVCADGHPGQSDDINQADSRAKTIQARSKAYLESERSKEAADEEEDKDKIIFDTVFAKIYILRSINVAYFGCMLSFSLLGLLR